jgi:hypothetical protein
MPLNQPDARIMAGVAVADDPSQALRLVMADRDGRPAVLPISPQFALALAGQLIAAAAKRLG